MRPGPGGVPCASSPQATHGAPSSRQGDELHELTPGRVSRSVRNRGGGGRPGDSAGALLPASRPEHGLHSTTSRPRAHWQSRAPGPHLSSG